MIARQANNLVQAVFGWSVTALFGRLRRRAQVLVTAALVASIVWPLFVIGVFAPHVSSWAIALVPLHHFMGDTALRIVWTSLAVAVPIIVGALVHLGAGKGRENLVSAMLRGYPLAIGFFLAFVTVVITVPIIKVMTLVRRWSDAHVYVEPHDASYDAAMVCLVDACKRAGLAPVVSDAPRAMVLATTIMRSLAGSAVKSFVGARLRRVTTPGLELYLYPGDLLMRGEPFLVARVRALLARTDLAATSYLVESDTAKPLQDELARLSSDVYEVRGHVQAAPELVQRLQHVYKRLMHADLEYDQWTVLDGLARKLERDLVTAHLASPDRFPLDDAADHAAPQPAAGDVHSAITARQQRLLAAPPHRA
jgi:hypothetical protein